MPTTPRLHRIGATAATLLGTVLILAASAASAQPHGTAARTKTVDVRNHGFSPSAISLHAGDSVRFRLTGGSHNVQFTRPANFHNSAGAPRYPRSGGSSMGSTPLVVRLTKKGTYRVRCAMHPDMTAKITVS